MGTTFLVNKKMYKDASQLLIRWGPRPAGEALGKPGRAGHLSPELGRGHVDRNITFLHKYHQGLEKNLEK